jgi:hypothetical protein
MPVPADDCAPEIALSIQSEFHTAAKLCSLIASALRWTQDPRSLVARQLVYAVGVRANSRQSWSTDFLKRSGRRRLGPARIRTS